MKKIKLVELDCPFGEGDFDVFGFIGNTMNATCRPGEGPKRDGTRARNNLMCVLQRLEEVAWLQMADDRSTKWNELSRLGPGQCQAQ